jgi:Fur family zinc uptake transcriptional regulator
MDAKTIFKEIRSKGGRITRVRSEIVKMLAGEGCLISRAAIMKRLKKLRMEPDRSTLFRELHFLAENGVIVRNDISGVDYYEIQTGGHHHHLVCLSCNAIKKVDMKKHLEEQEKEIARNNKFEIITHSLEFYGYCGECKN